MPEINKDVHYWPSRWVLFARCPHCGYLLNWVNDQHSDGEIRAASCCDLVFHCQMDSENCARFILTTHVIDMTNVSPLKG